MCGHAELDIGTRANRAQSLLLRPPTHPCGKRHGAALPSSVLPPYILPWFKTASLQFQTHMHPLLFTSAHTCTFHQTAGVQPAQVRQLAQLTTTGWSYNQRGVVATVSTEWANTSAWQVFLPSGPVALLPVRGELSNIVWSTSQGHARELEGMSSEEFADAVNQVSVRGVGQRSEAGEASGR